ncbi:hypothetical protein HYH03_004130 [Edaphochlamys debaryana]|uniref:RAP domain-containing protein n=1 Tax=Edaphochlamys debaryana TaxID=47281 RepID=A0A835Y9Y9_9CHLO|nr:hypothetical protein HYH03_004130 [Edaphochlamys debaryana]|eukprot:KAG2497864.1 hypothetical protein HYH03_004130 [Edaphochlamys debaryana]
MRALLVGWLARQGRGSAAAAPATNICLGPLLYGSNGLSAPAAAVPWAAAETQPTVLSLLLSAEGLLPTAGAAAIRGLTWNSVWEQDRVVDPYAAIVACRDLRELRALVDREAAGWSRMGLYKPLCTAINRASKLGAMHGADTASCHSILRTLAAAYLPLVAGVPDGAKCTIPLHACAKAGYWSGGLAAALADKSSEGRQLLLGIDLPQLLEASAESLPHMTDTAAQACSNILLAYARLKQNNNALADHLTARLVEVRGEASPQELANALYALGELAVNVKHKPRPATLRRLFEAVTSRLSAPGKDRFTAQALSNRLLGCFNLGSVVSSLRQYALQLAEQLAQECQRRSFAGFNAQDFGNTAWALAKMGIPESGWYAAAMEAAARPGAMHGAVPQAWSNLWYALALVRHQPASGRLLKRTAEAAGELRQGADSQACANLLWALANLQLYDKRLVDALAGRLGELLGQDPKAVKGQELCNSLWALAVMGPDVLSRHSGLVGRAAAARGGATTAAVARATKLAEDTTDGKSLEDEVAATLQQLKAEGAIVSVQRRVVLEGLGRYAEALVERADGRRVAVETVIPADLLASGPHPRQLAGSTELRLRQLEREEGAGEVVRVPYWEWKAVKDEAGRRAYLRQLLGVGPANKDEVSDQAHANLWWSLSEAAKGAEGRQVLSSCDYTCVLGASAEGLLATRSLLPQTCSNILLACARLKWGNNALLTHLTACLAEARPRAECQALANSLYAIGELAEDVGHKPRAEDLRDLAEEVVQRLSGDDQGGRAAGQKEFKPQELTNMLLGCAKLVCTDPRFLRALVGADSLQPTVRTRGGAVEALAEECKRRRFSGFTAQGLANAAWALAKMGYDEQGLYAAAAEAAERPRAMQGAVPQAWSNLWYALALLRHRPASESRLLEQTAEAAGGLRQGAKAQHCANLLWALAILRLYDERLVDALAGRLGELLGQGPAQLKPQEISNSLSALRIAGPDVLSRHSGLVEGLLREMERRWVAGDDDAFSKAELPQLWYTQLELAHVGGGELQHILGAGEDQEGSLLRAAKAAAETHAVNRAAEQPSDLERQVASTLEQLQQQMGPGAIDSVQRRYVVEEVGRFVEILVELSGGRRVPVETVGRSDVYANAPHNCTPIGPLVLHSRLLEWQFGQGNVVQVPYWEWEAAKGGQLGYLSRRLGLGEA